MGYIDAPIQYFINKNDKRADTPVIFNASDGRDYAKVVLNEPCPEGVRDFSDGDCYTVFAPVEVLNTLMVGETVRVTLKEE